MCEGGCGNGFCAGSNNCTCNAGWRGVRCDVGEMIVCFLYSMPAICSTPCVNGICTAPNTCTCNEHWGGNLCDQCADGWTADDCGTGMVPMILASTHVSAICREGCDHGTCSTPGDCDCNSHWTGARCNMCAIGYSGSDCNTGLIDALQMILKSSHLQRGMQERRLQ
jgi:hypothetical protein